MLEYWDTANAVRKSKTCNEARNSDSAGYGKPRHTCESKGFLKIEFEMTEENNSVKPSIIALIKRTHTKANGTFVDKYAEEICEEVYSLAAQMSPATSDDEYDSGDDSTVSTPWPIMLNKAFYKRVPVRKGNRFGLGSIHHHEQVQHQHQEPPNNSLTSNHHLSLVHNNQWRIELVQ
ncbi:unnamed protein product [Microthlaspi erraticum]|uniref:Uncharacterized protein n=1 Tax=Microthlaspi erraticum TaxID=1685480 RepID=A0A6D2IBV4_9BRAS|nr:unnamed protein product [Microthlaspi erraticum]